MSRAHGSSPMRVERVLRLLPEVDVLAPLRSLLIATSRPHAAEEQHVTVGKRIVRSGRLSELIPESIQRVGEHLTALYYRAVEALDAEERGDIGGAVRAFLEASRLEARVGRETQARTWIEHALRIAEEARDRRPEIETLHELGKLEAALGSRDKAARLYQRAFALAEAEGDGARAAASCLALGTIALQRGTPQGAVSWFSRGLQHTDGNAAMTGRLHLGMADVLIARKEPVEARKRLTMAEECLGAGGGVGLVELRLGLARLAASLEEHDEAIAHYRAALDHAQRATHDPRIELPVRLDLCRFLLASDRLVEAEDEARRAEEHAVVHNLTNDLARLYIIMGGIRRQQRDESGFVFFEKAIELSRGGEPAPLIEAEAYHDYGLFRRAFDDAYEARAYLERAREILETLGDSAGLARVDSELERTPA